MPQRCTRPLPQDSTLPGSLLGTHGALWWPAWCGCGERRRAGWGLVQAVSEWGPQTFPTSAPPRTQKPEGQQTCLLGKWLAEGVNSAGLQRMTSRTSPLHNSPPGQPPSNQPNSGLRCNLTDQQILFIITFSLLCYYFGKGVPGHLLTQFTPGSWPGQEVRWGEGKAKVPKCQVGGRRRPRGLGTPRALTLQGAGWGSSQDPSLRFTGGTAN